MEKRDTVRGEWAVCGFELRRLNAIAGELGACPGIKEAIMRMFHPPEEPGLETCELMGAGRIRGAIMKFSGIRGEVVEFIFGDGIPDVFPTWIANHALRVGTELISGVGGEDIGTPRGVYVAASEGEQ